MTGMIHGNGAAGRALVAFAYGVFFPVCAVIVSVVDCLQGKQRSSDVHWPGEVKTGFPALPLPSSRCLQKPFKLFQRRIIYCRSHVNTQENNGAYRHTLRIYGGSSDSRRIINVDALKSCQNLSPVACLFYGPRRIFTRRAHLDLYNALATAHCEKHNITVTVLWVSGYRKLFVGRSLHVTPWSTSTHFRG